MKIRFPQLVAISMVIVFGFVSISSLVAQDKAKARQNVQGTVQDISKDTSVITIRNGTRSQSVAYNASTKFIYGHSDKGMPGSAAQLKTSYYISCLAALDDAKKQLMASECVYRETK